MVTDENKYWFDDDDKTQPNPSEPVRGNEDGDLFGENPAPAPELTAPSASPVSPSAPDDPHARHYQSDFAERVNTPRGDLNKSGRIKALRGHMLNKLLKYDYRAVFRFLVPCYIVVVALAALCSLSFLFTRNLDSYTVLRVRSTIYALYSMSILVCAGGCTIVIATRFQKNLFSGEGYLTLSIPATPEEHIFSKLISGLTTILLTWAVTGLSFLIVALPYSGDVLAYVKLFFENIGALFADYPLDTTLSLFELLLLVPLAALGSLELIHCCICVGQMFTTKNRTGAAVLCFFIFTVILETVAVFLATIPGIGSFFNALGDHGSMWFFIALLAGFDVGTFFFQRYVVKKRVNLA